MPTEFVKFHEFNLQDKPVLGNAAFRPPFRASAALLNEARFVYVVNGRSKLHSPTSTVELTTGDSFVMKCENFVNNWLENADGAPSEIIVVIFYPEILKLAYDDRLPEVLTKPHGPEPNPIEVIPDGEMIRNYCTGLHQYFGMPEIISDELLKLKIRELIVLLINSDTTGRIQAILSGLFQTREHAFSDIVHAHLFEDLRLEELAFMAGLSLSSFKRKFKQVFGTSPAVYIKGKRLSKAEQLLKSSELRISEIAYNCGFNDTSYFAKVFTAAYQVSPTEYRKNFVG